MSSNAIQVCIKMGPRESHQSSLWQVVDGRSIKPAVGHAKPSAFDHVFDEGASNKEVFDQMAKHVVHSCLQGFNATILAYGQSSSGKTYTMVGDAQNPGVMVLAAKEIFHQIANDTEREFLLRVGHIGIYNDKINDLLNKEKENPDVQIHEAAGGALSVGCEEVIVASEDQLLDLLCPQHTNERSKGSHDIFRITIESRKPECPGYITQSVLNLVDLAGPNVSTNISLMFLRKVMKNLSEMDVDDRFINFRDSKLTRILKPTLCGNGLTAIICTIKPWAMKESESTLNFATVAKKIDVKPHANNIVCNPRMEQLDTEIRYLQDQVAAEKLRGGSPIYLIPLENRIQDILSQFVPRGKLCELTKLAEMEANFNEIRGEYDGVSNQLLESARENEALPEELKQSAKLSEEDLRAFLEDLKINVCELQAKMESQSKQMQLKDTNIAELKAEIEKLVKAQEKLLDAQSQKLSDVDLNLLMEQQQEGNAKLAQNEVLKARLAEMELNIARLELENRKAVVLESQFEAYKKKSGLREKDLLAALSDKDKELQCSYEALELQRQHQQDQQGAIETLQADFQTIQQKYQKLQVEYEQLGHFSNAFEEQCQQLQADNTRLQAEIGTLKERVEVAQRSIKVISSDNALHIEQLQEGNALLAEVQSQLEGRPEPVQTIPSSEPEKKQIEVLGEALRKVSDEAREKQMTDEINALHLQYMTDKLKSSLSEATGVSSNLQEQVAKLQSQLEKEQKAGVSLRAKLVEFEEANTRLEEQLRAKEAKEAEMGQKLELGRHSVGKLAKKCDQLRIELQTKNTALDSTRHHLKTNNQLLEAMKSEKTSLLKEMERMSATCSSLLEDKRNLEEKQCSLNEILTKMKAELAVSRAPQISGGTSSNALAAPSKSTQDRHAATMRRDQRMTAQDERRRNVFWDDSLGHDSS